MVDLLVTYMETRAVPAEAAPPAPDIAVTIERLSPHRYLELYRAIGGPHQWDQRLRLSAQELDGVLADTGSRIFVLRKAGTAMGMCEFAKAGEADVELVNFGLVPQAQGAGAGRFLLHSALRGCWTATTRRIWLHTDTNDHPRATSVYERAGFRPYLQRMETFPD